MEIVTNNNSDSTLIPITEECSIDHIKFFEEDIELIEDVEQSKGEVVEMDKPTQRSRVYTRSSNPEVNGSNIKCIDSIKENHTKISDVSEKYEEKVEECHTLVTISTDTEDCSVNLAEGLFRILRLIARPVIMLFNRLDYFSVVFTLACVVLIFILEFLKVSHTI